MKLTTVYLKNEKIFFHEEELRVSKEQEEEFRQMLKKFNLIKNDDEISSVETMISFKVHKRGN